MRLFTDREFRAGDTMAGGLLGLLFLFLLGILLFAIGLGGGQREYDYEIFPSPDRRLSLVIETDANGGATVGATYGVYLAAATWAGLNHVGEFEDDEPSSADGWVAGRAVNVCGLRRPMGGAEAREEIGEILRAQAVQLTTNCAVEP